MLGINSAAYEETENDTLGSLTDKTEIPQIGDHK
jgi:hypothetical protein